MRRAYTFFSSLALAVTGAVIAYAPPAFSQTPHECDSVLNLTGRESTVTFSSDVRSAYINRLNNSSNGWGGGIAIPINGVPIGVNAQGNSAESQAEASLVQTNTQFMQDANTVFAPAVSAWLACVKGHKKFKIDVSLIGPRDMVVNIRNRSLDNQKWGGVQAVWSVISCPYLTSRPRTLKPGKSLHFRCRRIDHEYGVAKMTLIAGGQLHAITWPALEQPRRDAVLNQSKQMPIGNCGGTTYLKAAPYDRKIIVSGFHQEAKQLHDTTPTEAGVKINGQQVILQNVQGGSDTNTFELPAYTPGVVWSYGGFNPGDCGSVSATLWYP